MTCQLKCLKSTCLHVVLRDSILKFSYHTISVISIFGLLKLDNSTIQVKQEMFITFTSPKNFKKATAVKLLAFLAHEPS